jgi:hypothetical protein
MRSPHILQICGPVALTLLCLGGCASVPPPEEMGCRFDGAEDVTPAATRAARTAELSASLGRLGEVVDPLEAHRVAELVLQTSSEQRRDYDITTTALAHNLMVVRGTKKRGLCIHWTRDLLDTLRAQDLQTFTLYWGIANEGNVFTEHSTVVIAARGGAFEDGLVLDGWRHSGCLYWGPVTTDKYRWKQAAHYDSTAAR